LGQVKGAALLPEGADPVRERNPTSALSTIFTAARTDDVAKFDSVIASDFYIYDGGARFNGDAVMNLIRPPFL
jgi:hypothetical protein